MAFNTGDNSLVATHERKQFVEGITQAMQYTKAVLVPFFDFINIEGSEASFDRIGIADDMRENTQRYASNPVSEIPHDRRWATYKYYDLGKEIEPKDKDKVVTDPTSAYTEAIKASVSRREDKTILQNIFAPVKTGLTSATGVMNFVTTNSGKVSVGEYSSGFAGQNKIVTAGQTQLVAGDYEGIDIAVNYNGTASPLDAGLTTIKLRALRKVMNQLDPEWAQSGQLLPLFVTEAQHDQLLGITEVQNNDYNDKKVLVDGKVTQWMGFRIIIYNGLLGSGTSGDPRQCFCATPAGLKYIRKDMKFDLFNLPHKKQIPYIMADLTNGAVRMQGEKVARINCLD